MKVLITSGATREPIDSVRFISNISTGNTGATLAEFFAARGTHVTYLHGKAAILPQSVDGAPPIRMEAFTDVRSLDEALKKHLQNEDFDLVIHAAAVSDYQVSSVTTLTGDSATIVGQKLSSQSPNLRLELRSSPKLIAKLRGYSRNPKIRIVGFKLTDGATQQQVAEAVARIAPSSDWIAHNDLSEMRRSPIGEHPFGLYQPNGQRVATPRSVRELGETLWQQQESTHAAHH